MSERPSGPAWRSRGADPRTTVLLVVAAILVVLALRTFHISEDDVVFFCALIPSIILHEVTHGWVALAFGDDTAKRSGRLTLNPLKHVDPIGTVIVPVVLLVTQGWAFGWAKPVPVNISRLRSPRNQSVIVSLAGPVLNIALAMIAGLILDIVPAATLNAVIFGFNSGTGSGPVWAQYVFWLGYVNVILAVFNLIPIPPLDGSAVIERLIPNSWLGAYLRIRPYTMIILLIIILWSGGAFFNRLFIPAIHLWARLFT